MYKVLVFLPLLRPPTPSLPTPLSSHTPPAVGRSFPAEIAPVWGGDVPVQTPVTVETPYVSTPGRSSVYMCVCEIEPSRYA